MHVYRFVLVGEKEEDESEVFVNLGCYLMAKLQNFYHNNKYEALLLADWIYRC